MFAGSTYTFLHTQTYYVREYILNMKINSLQKYNGNNIKKCIETLNNLDENKSNNNTNNDTFCFFSID